jgi:hypothetical protein
MKSTRPLKEDIQPNLFIKDSTSGYIKGKDKSRSIGLHKRHLQLLLPYGDLPPSGWFFDRKTQSRRPVAAVAVAAVIAATVATIVFIIVKGAPGALALRVDTAVIRAFVFGEGVRPFGVYILVVAEPPWRVLIGVVSALRVVDIVFVGRKFVVVQLGEEVPVLHTSAHGSRRGSGCIRGRLLGLRGIRKERFARTGGRSMGGHGERYR